VISPLRPGTKKALLIVLCLGALSIYVARVVNVYLAQSLGNSSQRESQIADLERAIYLVPRNAEFPHLLGLRLSVSDQNDERTIANLRNAVRLNPNRGHYWIDLASVYQITGNVDKEKEALQSALNAEPGNPEVAAEAARLFLESGEANRAFPLVKQALEQNPAAASAVLPECWDKTPDANLILTQAVPANPELQLAFLRVLTEREESTAASEAWQFIIAANKPFRPQLSLFYFDYLLKEQDVATFSRAWRELARLAPEMRAYLPNDNLIVNSGFEQPPLNWGFGWRYQTSDHIAVGVDDKVAHSGSHSLSLSYDGDHAYMAGWTQYVPVEANADYDFSAWIKSENVTTSSGPRIALVDAFSGANLLLTDDVLDTHPWHELKGTLRVPADTQLLAVQIVRAPANTRIRGQIWIDDLRLVKRQVER
jgi:tetratricopeptide (TPR) repeat protein